MRHISCAADEDLAMTSVRPREGDKVSLIARPTVVYKQQMQQIMVWQNGRKGGREEGRESWDRLEASHR
jgi:hypothetical protein